jgi:stage IV sporulation protein FB
VHVEGYALHLGRVFGQPVSVHASLPLGLLFFTGMRFAPGAWLGIVVLVLMHELGHGALVKLRGGRVVSVTLHGLGGECAHTGATTPLDRAIIAWGGVLGQFWALPITYALLFAFGPPSTMFVAQLASVFIETNVIMIVINLLPMPPLDGARAWNIIPLLRARASSSRPGPKPRR